ncbi:MAG: hypothetical protein LAT63_03885 [Marinobacter sp.]|nr:hypothetical protein [Marinobacter sp.]
MKRLTTTCLTLALSLSAAALSPLALADQHARGEKVIPIMGQGQEHRAVARPGTGQSSQQVRARFGEPQQVDGPVGHPPISQWHYPEFTVYFEYDHVIHTVLRHRGAGSN